MSATPSSSFSRRALVRGAAWAVPTAAVAGIAPAYALSSDEGPTDIVCNQSNSWHAKSTYTRANKSPSTEGFDEQYFPTRSTAEPAHRDGAFQIQHFEGTKSGEAVIAWRFPLEFEYAMAAGSVRIEIPKDDSWASMPTELDYLIAKDRNYDGHTVQEWFYKGFATSATTRRSGLWSAPIKAFEDLDADAPSSQITREYEAMPAPTVAFGTDKITLTWDTAIPAHSMLIFQLLAKPKGGSAALADNQRFVAQATVTFTPVC